MNTFKSLLLFFVIYLYKATAFVAPRSLTFSHRNQIKPTPYHAPSQPSKSITPHQPSRSNNPTTALPSLFGLGPLELVTIAFAGLLVIGPTKLAEMSRQAGQVAGKSVEEVKDAKVPEEWKAIPQEFKKGVEEGEIEARGRKAKLMDGVDD